MNFYLYGKEIKLTENKIDVFFYAIATNLGVWSNLLTSEFLIRIQLKMNKMKLRTKRNENKKNSIGG